MKIKMKALSVAVALLCAAPSLMADDAFTELERESQRVNQSQKQKIEEFKIWLDDYLTEYESWRDEHTKQLDQQRTNLIDSWGSGEISDNTKSVDYSNDNTVKTVVDYETNVATVSVLVDADEPNQSAQLPKDLLVDGQTVTLVDAKADIDYITYSPEQEKREKQFIITHLEQQMKELDIQADRLINSNIGVPDSFIYERAFLKKKDLIAATAPRLAAISAQFARKRAELGIELAPEVVESSTSKPVVDDVDAKEDVSQEISSAHAPKNKESQTVASEDIVGSDEVAKTDTVKEKTSEKEEKKTSLKNEKIDLASASADTFKPVPVEPETQAVTKEPAQPLAEKAAKKVVSYKVKLPNNSLTDRAETFLPVVEKESKRWEVDAALVMAIMHSESSFRPTAKSHVPAYGLMQVVPTSAGHDVNKMFRNIDAPMKANDLYQPDINVETGVAYLNILQQRYLKSIENDESRMYSAIAAYNTGAGNVAKAFNKDRSTNIRKASVIINQMTPDEVYEHLLENLPYEETRNYLKKVNGRISLYQ